MGAKSKRGVIARGCIDEMVSELEAMQASAEAMARAIESGHMMCDRGGCGWTDRTRIAAIQWRRRWPKSN